MSAWPTIQRYDLDLAKTGGYGTPYHGEAEFLEMRKPDDWGNPDKLVSSQLLWVRLSDGTELEANGTDKIFGKGCIFQIRHMRPSHPARWHIQEFD